MVKWIMMISRKEVVIVLSKEVLQLLGISCPTLTKDGKTGVIRVTELPNKRYDYQIEMIQYKAQEAGIKVRLTEESYTSGTSFLDGEEPVKKNYNKSRRVHRGLFISNRGMKINADINASYQILKKVFPEAYANGIEGVVLHPVRVNIAF